MKKSLQIFVLVCSTVFSSGMLYAQELRPYLGIGLGSYWLDFGSGSDATFGGFAQAGVDFNDYVGAEIRFHATNDAFPPLARARMRWGVSYLVKPQYPVSGDINVYALAGASTLETSVFSSAGTFVNNSTGLSYGAGAEYRMMDGLKAGVEWTRYSSDADINAPTFPGLDVDGLVVRLQYSF